jgi:hypothetical protein
LDFFILDSACLLSGLRGFLSAKTINYSTMDIQSVNGTYLLLKRFRFPTGNTTKDAIAVSSSNGLTLVSLYTLMVKVAISQIWGATVLLGVAFAMRKKHSYNRAAATAGIYNSSASTSTVVRLLIKYLKPMKDEIWYPILWAIAAVLAIAGTSAGSILIPKLLIIGNAAPVNASTVYFPGTILNHTELSDKTTISRAFALTVPYYQRSAAQVAVTPQNSIVVTQVGNTDLGFVQINYNYNITAAEFGLQYAPGLILNVNGSCYTEYGWWTGVTDNAGGDIKDTYNLWNDPTNHQVNVSGRYDGGPPFPFFVANPDPPNFEANPDLPDATSSNISYAIVVSSLNRPSYTMGTDPWYLTTNSSVFQSGEQFHYIVSTGRPALSCWENDIFTYNGKSVDQFNLNALGLPGFISPNGVDTPFLTDILQSVMSPVIVNLGVALGRSALKSASSSALGVAFDAESSSIFQDLQYLIMASYIATKNVFLETTRFPLSGRDGIPDIARSLTSDITVNNSLLPRLGTTDFVITDSAIATLSVRAIIAIPVAMAVAVGAVFLLGLLPTPWRVSHALNATVLYSHLHEREERVHGEDAEWDREGAVAFSPRNGEAKIMPVYHVPSAEKKGKKKAGFYWLPTKTETKTETEKPVLLQEKE